MKSKTMTSFSMTSLLTVTIMTWAVDGQAGKCHTCFSSNPGGNFATDAWEAITGTGKFDFRRVFRIKNISSALVVNSSNSKFKSGNFCPL